MNVARKQPRMGSRKLGFLVTFLVTLLFGSPAFSDQVRHLFDHDTGSFSLQTNGACGALQLHRDAIRCNPALLRKAGQNRAIIELTALSDEKTFRVLWRVANDPLTSEDIEKLFSKNSFLYFSGYGRVATTTKWFELEYVPVAVSGAYRISNPSLPFIQVSGIQKSSYAFVSSLASTDFSDSLPFSFSVGAKLFYQTRKRSSIDVDALSALADEKKDYVLREQSEKFDANVGAFLSFEPSWTPQFGVVCDRCLVDGQHKVQPGKLETTQSDFRETSAHVAWELPPGIGIIWFSSVVFWQDAFETFLWEKSALSVGYGLNGFALSGSYSPERTGWGFVAQRGYYHIGMQYAFEKQPAVFQINRYQKLYLSVGAAL